MKFLKRRERERDAKPSVGLRNKARNANLERHNSTICSQERLRPPTYNAEDYAIALRRWGRRPLGNVQDSHGTLPSTTSSSSGYASGSGEMTLRQFTSVSELLNKLRADLRLAFPRSVIAKAVARSPIGEAILAGRQDRLDGARARVCVHT